MGASGEEGWKHVCCERRWDEEWALRLARRLRRAAVIH